MRRSYGKEKSGSFEAETSIKIQEGPNEKPANSSIILSIQMETKTTTSNRSAKLQEAQEGQKKINLVLQVRLQKWYFQ